MKWIKWNAVDRNKKSDSSSKQYVCYYIPISIIWALSLSLHLPLTRSEAEAGQAQKVSNKESRSTAIKEIEWEEWAELGEK